jgi:hypothetical protein
VVSLIQRYWDCTWKWLRLHAGCAVTIGVPKRYGAAVTKSACAEIAVNGFKNTSVFPL